MKAYGIYTTEIYSLAVPEPGILDRKLIWLYFDEDSLHAQKTVACCLCPWGWIRGMECEPLLSLYLHMGTFSLTARTLCYCPDLILHTYQRPNPKIHLS